MFEGSAGTKIANVKKTLFEHTMTWIELCRFATHTHCELLVLDSGLKACAASRNPWLHACMAAEVPTLEALCTALDAHGVPPSQDVEAQIVMPLRFAQRPEETAAQLPEGARVIA